jgi:hypothetical protein
LTKNKRVLHIGCCDHIPLISKKIQNKQWLHSLLLDNCSFVAGIDINEEAIQYVRNNVLLALCPPPPPIKYNNQNIYYSDITISLPQELKDMIFDFAILGEVVEHTNDPVAFLKKIKLNLGKTVEKIIVTVPNALKFRESPIRWRRIDSIHKESINSDHRYWFTPYTIAKVLVESGIYPAELLFCNPPYWTSVMQRKLHLKKVTYHSIFSDTLLVIGSLNKKIW